MRLAVEKYAFLCDLREFDVRQGWRAYHFNNCAEWLSWKCGISPATGREKIRVANQVFRLPRIAEAFSTGRLGYSKVSALTRVADQSNEAELLDYALAATAFQVDNYCRRLRNGNAALSTEDANRAHDGRFLSRSVNDDGSMTITVQLPQDTGELVMKAVEIAMNAQAREDNDPDPRADSYFARQADALGGRGARLSGRGYRRAAQ